MAYYKTVFLILIMILSCGNGFSQKIELNHESGCNTKVINFEDGSYVVYLKSSQLGKNLERKWLHYAQNGSLINERSIDGEIAWDYTNDSRKPTNSSALHSMVDPDKKVCYSLYTSEKELKMYVTGLDLKTKEILIPSTVFKAKYSGLSTSEVFYIRDHSMQSYFDNKGNPCWLIQKNSGGYVFVNYDPATEKANVKFNEMKTEVSIVGYKFIGRKDGKSWMIEMIDKGVKKSEYKIKLFSIDDEGTQKEEGVFSFPKGVNVVNTNVRDVTSLDGTDQLLFAVTHHTTKMTEIDFFTFDEDLKCVKWNVDEGSTFQIVPVIGHHKSSDGTDDFILYDAYTGIKFDVNFPEESLLVTAVEKQYNSGYSSDAWNFLLYMDDLNEEEQNKIKELLTTKYDNQSVYRINNGEFLILKEANSGKEKPEKGEVYLEIFNLSE